MRLLIGIGKDENKQDVIVTIDLHPDEALFWSGYYEEGDDNHVLNLESLIFYNADTFGGKWTDEETQCRYSIEEGKVRGGNRKNNKPYDISFVLQEEGPS